MTVEELNAQEYWWSGKTHGPRRQDSKIHISDREWNHLCGVKSMYIEHGFAAILRTEGDNVIYAENASSSIAENVRIMDMPKHFFCTKCVKAFESKQPKDS